VVTLVTVQNSVHVSRVEVLAARLVLEQLEAVLEDIPPRAAKTGALDSAEAVVAVAEVQFSTPWPGTRASGPTRSLRGCTRSGIEGDLPKGLLVLNRDRHFSPSGTIQPSGLPDAWGAGAGNLARVNRQNRAPAILVTQKVMAAFNAKNAKAYAFECGDEAVAGDAGIPAHAAMVTRWMPMNSKSCAGAPSTSRHNSIASRTRSITSSRDCACVWHTGICGTEAT
jgi:hypothetical protein